LFRLLELLCGFYLFTTPSQYYYQFTNRRVGQTAPNAALPRYPKQIFTIVIWSQDRPKFARPETTLRGKSICVTGKIEQFRGVAQVTATNPDRIKPQP
jgi:hypothetical protein